jgi:NADPH:quinone reductase-like Zn-dependent oxidoreductase
MEYTVFVPMACGFAPRNRSAPATAAVRWRKRAVGLNFRDSYVIRGNRYRAPLKDAILMTDAAGGGGRWQRFQRARVGDRVCSTVRRTG